MIIINKTFRIFYIIIKFNDITIILNKKYTQIDQRFNINIIFIEFVKFLKLQLHLLKEIEFKNLLIRIINQRETVLQYFI